jgi:uncharacterized protein
VKIFRTPAWLDKPWKRWTARAVFWAIFLLVVFPYFLSRAITTPPDVSWSGATPEDFHLEYEPFTVTSFDGLKISAWWIPANHGERQATSDKPLVVFAHGLGDSKSGVLVNAQFLHERGYSCCLIDLRNHGESDKRLVTLGAHEARDVEAVLQWLRQNKGADSFILWGVSLGAASSLIAAVDEPDVDGIILEAGYESMLKTVERHRRLFFGWVPPQPFIPLTLLWFRLRTGVEPDEVDVAGAASRLKRGRLFLMAGEKDERAPPEAGRAIQKASSIPARLWVMPGIDHDSLGGHPEYENQIAKFLEEVTMEKRQ